MTIEISYLGILGTSSIIFLFYILARLSHRLGSVQKMPPIYRYYYVASIFGVIGCVTQLLVARANSAPLWWTSPWFLFVAYHLPLIIGVSLSLVITWRYWSWLITEQLK